MQNQPILETTDWNMETLAKFLPEAVSLSIIIGKWMDECNCFLEENFNFACVSSYFAHHVWDLGYFHFQLFLLYKIKPYNKIKCVAGLYLLFFFILGIKFQIWME